ncbi:hypothetical protein K435DRAFT_663126 [Dendrothele bispora CBS 962.96]|uniref:Xylanolytic transcriptional activator regulatory domain-containing protein n=1 Tax=Dendrothele bispora (strain CBS 962.96) TaxID=1314807 RepID=A0A4S8M4P8_DENBC|nr:hypothetical protein K435DRAFT_663126 [Dendrothele bispora CBS 962.96]
MERLSLNQSRHFGPSSTLALVKTAMDIEDALPQDAQIPSSQSSQFVGCRRPEFWAIYPWQIPIEESPPPLEFPEEDLIQDLIRLFFTNCAQFIPVLHRPTFERSVAEGLHFNDRHFGHLLLAICALASRYSNDPRIFVKGSTQEFSCGWQWFRQIKLFRNSYVTVPSIYEVQVCISVLFLQGSSTPEACWLLVSHGIRLAQDQGAHRIKSNPNNPKPKLSDELWKRTFWMLYVIDTIVSAFSGRPRATTNDDFDLDLPVENDDDFWEVPDPEIAFRQPPGRALVISYGSAIVKLMDILGTAQRTIYATRRSDIWTMIGLSDAEANQRILSELDASLNDWIDKIPEHLKWDPNRENMVFFHQSVLLYVSYYWVQILVHKPFITRPGTDTDLSFPSLAICVNAARSAVHVMEVQQRRGFLPWPNVVLSLYSSAVVLVLNAWRGKHFKTSSETSKEMIEVYKCIRMIRSYEKRLGVFLE